MTITKKELQLRFKFEVAALAGGELVKRCFDCGTCAGVCPVSEAEAGFDPRSILHMIKLGLKERLLSSEAIWYCTHCDACAFVCPQNVEFSGVIDVLREMAIKEGYVAAGVVEQWGTSPCKANCPAHISIPGFISAIGQGRYREGLKLIRRDLPFPGVCGRVCPHPCEAECNRGLLDQAIAIMSLKRYLADLDLRAEAPYVPETKDKRAEKIAVIGAGPAGLTAAYYLAIEGYRLTVFEKLPVAGGMMTVGIPEYRLPRDILQAEIDVIRHLGVEIKLNCEVGRSFSFDDLRKDFKAIFVSAGCHRSMRLGIPGEEELEGVVDALRFLREVHLGSPLLYPGRLVVIGGGNAAVDCARVGVRLGYKDVAILYRRTREEMPAFPWEVAEAIEEGVDIQFLTAPVKIMGKNGKVCGLECIRMSLAEPDSSGRKRPVAIKESKFTMKADVVVTAIGQTSDLSFLSKNSGVKVSERNLIKVDSQTGSTNVPGIFAGGDVAFGPRTVIEAVASAKRAATSIDSYLRGQDIRRKRRPDWHGIEFAPEEIERRQRESAPRLPVAERRRTFQETNGGFEEGQAKREAERCLRLCGIQKNFQA